VVGVARSGIAPLVSEDAVEDSAEDKPPGEGKQDAQYRPRRFDAVTFPAMMVSHWAGLLTS